MEIKYILKLFIKWLWLIILLPSLSGAGAYYVSGHNNVTIYEAKATMYIINSSSDPEARTTAVYGDIISAQNAVEYYAEIIKSKTTITEALDGLGIKEYPAERFFGNINLLFPTRDSFVFGISVNDADPKLASDMANELSERFVEKINQLMKMPVIQILDRAEIPQIPSNDNTTKNVALAFMAGILFCVVIIFIAEYAGSVSIHSGKDVEKYLGLTVLACVPKIRHK